MKETIDIALDQQKHKLVRALLKPWLEYEMLQKEQKTLDFSKDNVVEYESLWVEQNMLNSKISELCSSLYPNLDEKDIKNEKKLLENLKSKQFSIETNDFFKNVNDLEEIILNTKQKIEYDKEIKNIKEQIEILKTFEKEYKTNEEKIEKILEKINEYKLLLNYGNVDYSTLEEDIVNYTKQYNQNLQIKLDIGEQKKLLENHEYDPNCKYCCNNELVKHAKKMIDMEDNIISILESQKTHLENQRTVLKDLKEYHSIVSKYETLKEKKDNLDKKVKELHILENKLKELYEKASSIDQSKVLIINVKDVEDYLKDYNEFQHQKPMMEMYQKNITLYNEKVESNEKVNKKLLTLREKFSKNKKYLNILSALKDAKQYIVSNESRLKEAECQIRQFKDYSYRKNELDSALSKLAQLNTTYEDILKMREKNKSDIEHLTADIEKSKQYKEKLEKVSLKTRLLEKLKIMYDKKGIPKKLVNTVIEVIENKINLVLERISHLKVRLVQTDMALDIKVMNKENKYEMSYKMLCGSEKFYLELAFRIAFQKLSNISHPNFMIIDEGWSGLDMQVINGTQISLIVDELLKTYSLVLTVSHIEPLQKILTKQMVINKDVDGSSYINFY